MSRISNGFNNVTGALPPAYYDEPIVQSAGKPSAPPPAYEEPSALSVPAYSPGVEVSNKIHGRVEVLELDNLQEREIGFFERVYIAISRIFTTKYATLYADFRDLKAIAADSEPIQNADLPGIKEKLNHVLSSQKDAFVLDFSKKLLLNSQIDEAKELLEMHSDAKNPKVLFLRAAVFEQKRENTEVNGGEYVDDTQLLKLGNKSIKLEDITSLSVAELEVLVSGKVGKWWFLETIGTNNQFDHLLALYIRSSDVGDLVEVLNAEDKNGYTPLACAAFFGNAEVVNMLIAAAKDADVLVEMLTTKNKFDNIPLVFAMSGGHTEAVNALIAAAKEANVLADVLIAKNVDGDTPLILAAGNGRTEAVNALIAAAKDTNVLADVLTTKNRFGNTPLMHAATRGDTEVVNALIAAAEKEGVLVDVLTAKNEWDDIPLTLAAWNGRTEAVNALIAAAEKKGVLAKMLTAKTKSGDTPLTLARRRGHLAIVNILSEALAQVS